MDCFFFINPCLTITDDSSVTETECASLTTSTEHLSFFAASQRPKFRNGIQSILPYDQFHFWFWQKGEHTQDCKAKPNTGQANVLSLTLWYHYMKTLLHLLLHRIRCLIIMLQDCTVFLLIRSVITNKIHSFSLQSAAHYNRLSNVGLHAMLALRHLLLLQSFYAHQLLRAHVRGWLVITCRQWTMLPLDGSSSVSKETREGHQ